MTYKTATLTIATLTQTNYKNQKLLFVPAAAATVAAGVVVARRGARVANWRRQAESAQVPK